MTLVLSGPPLSDTTDVLRSPFESVQDPFLMMLQAERVREDLNTCLGLLRRT
jgi:hypothetical protein